MLALQGIRKRYGRSWVLDGVDLTAPDGQITAVIGGNGSGKSTLLRIAVGASAPTEGTARRPASIGYVPERLPATLRMNATQYLEHMGRIRGLGSAAIRLRSADLLERLALVPGPLHPVGELSKGNSQKVALAQALLEPVQLLVLDEPYSGLDEAAAAECTALMREARDRGAAVVVSAHQDLVVPDADARCTLAAGRITTSSHDRDVPARGGNVSDAIPVTDRGGARSMRVVLRAVSATADPRELLLVPGVREVEAEPPEQILTTDDADGLLRYALDHGWTLVEAGG